MSIEICVQPLTAQTFAPYGDIISASSTLQPDFKAESGTEGWEVNIDAKKPLYMVLKTLPTDLIVDRLECHLNVSQAFLPLGGSPAILVVSEPTEPTRPPELSRSKAFLLDGTIGYVLKVGTWHSLDRLPIDAEPTSWLMITDADTQADLANIPLKVANYTKQVDLTKAWGGPVNILAETKC